jgi:septum formation protein
MFRPVRRETPDWDNPLGRARSANGLFHKVILLSLILASSSFIRRSMLEQAGVRFESVASNIDEDAEKARKRPVEETVAQLAIAKASAVSSNHPADWVIGSDSIVAVDGRMFDKPADRAQAADHLRFFSGKTITLTSSVALVRGGKCDWYGTDVARLRVRALSEAFIEHYLGEEWPEVAYCVGVFRLESKGVQLFDAVDGNYFTILGMPLLPLLRALRDRGILES